MAGTLLAERLLDIAVILILFVVVGYGLLGELGAGSVGWIALATGLAVALGALGVVLVRRHERLHRAIEPVLSSPLGLRGRHGLGLLGATFLIWGIEAATWMAVGHAAGFPLDPIEGCYLVALASVFALIPSGPGYAGTQDAAAIIGLKALGGTGAQAVAYLLLLRFVIVVPITLAGLALMAVRYGGLRRLRGAPDGMRRPRRELLAYAALTAAALAVRLIDLGDRPFHHDESQDAYFSWLFATEGDYEYQPILHGPLRFYLTALVYLVLGDTDTTARLAPALMGTLIVPLPYLLRDQLGRVGAFAVAVALAFGPSYLYFSRFAREDIYVACLTLALIVVCFRFLERPRPHQPAVFGALLALSFATKETTFITVFVGGSFFLLALSPRPLARGRAGAAARGAAGGVGLVRRRLRRHLHAALHDLPDQSGRPVGGAARRPRLLARPARGRARRGAVVLLPRRAVRRGVAGAAARRRRRGGRRAAPDAAAAVPDLGLRRLAGRLLVGGREVRLARAPPAAAAAAARGHRRPGHLVRARALDGPARPGRDGRGRRLPRAWPPGR